MAQKQKPATAPPPRLADVIKMGRVAKGLSQEMLAELLQTNQSTVSGWERDETSPSLPMLDRIATALGIQRDTLIDAALDYTRRFEAGETHRRNSTA